MQMQENEAKTGNETETVSAQANTEDACLASGENVLLETATTNIKNIRTILRATSMMITDTDNNQLNY